MAASPFKDDLKLAQLALVSGYSLGAFIGAHWPDCEAAATARTARKYQPGELEEKLLKSFALDKAERRDTIVFYTTDDVMPRDTGGGDKKVMRSDMVAVLDGFRARLDGRYPTPIEGPDILRFLERRPHDLGLVAGSEDTRICIARFVEAVIRADSLSPLDAKKICSLCGGVIAMSKFDKSVQDEVWLAIFTVFMRTGNKQDALDLCKITGVGPCKCTSLFLWTRFESLVEPTAACKAKFVDLFRLHEMIMGIRH